MKKKIHLKKSTKILIAIIALLVLTGIGLVIGRNAKKSSSSAVQFYNVKQEVYENVIEISGTVSANQEQTLSASSAGTVLAVYVAQGDHVKKGDIIMQLDDTTERYNLAKHDYDMASKKYSVSAKEYELLQTQRLSLERKVEDRCVKATFDGIIASLSVKVGDYIDAKDSIGTIVDVSSLVATVEVAETDVEKLKVNQVVKLNFPAYNGTVQGYVLGWPAIGEVTNRGATIVKVKIKIDEYPSCILPKFSFSGKIEISPSEIYTIVSRYAVGRENGQAYVVKARNNEKVNVKVEQYSSEYVKITEGNLSNGELLLAQSSSGRSGMNRSQMGGSFGGGQGRSSASGGTSGGGFPGGGAGGPPGGF